MKRHALALLLGCATLLSARADTAAPAAAPPTALPEAQLRKLLAAYAIVKREYVGEVDDDRLFDGALAGMLAALDPHSTYLNKDDMREIGRESSGDYVGIGITVALDGERMRIVNVAAGCRPRSPASGRATP